MWQEHALEFHLCTSHRWWRVGMWRMLVADISRHAAKEALSPLVFKKILKRHVLKQMEEVECCSGLAGAQPLLNGLRSANSFLCGRDLSWQAFSDKGRSLSCLSGHSSPPALVSLGQLMALAPAINVFFEHADAIPAPSFCAMCWRFVLTGEKYCRVHRVPVAGAGKQSPHRDDGYWFGRKLSSQFVEHIRRLSSQARRERLRSGWKQVADIAFWLERYRPLVWEVVLKRVGRPEEDSVLLVVIQVLDEHSLETGVLKERRTVFHSSLLANRKAIFDLLLRAEAWLGAAAERRANWGGSRIGAGRPLREAGSARQLV